MSVFLFIHRIWNITLKFHVNIPWKFRVDILIRSVSGRGGQEGWYLEDIKGSWSETWRTWLFLMSWMMFPYPKEDTLKVLFLYLYWKYVRKGGGSRRGYLEDIEGSWSETWRTWLFLMSWMMFLYSKEDTQKVLCWYLYWKYVRKGGSKRGDLEDIEGSWQETWRTGSSLMSWMTLFDPKDHILKVSGCYLHVLWSYKWSRSKWPTSVVRLG